MSDQKEIRLPEGLDVETATDVLREYARTDGAQITNTETLESLREEIAEAKEAFAAVLAEESPQSADTLARQEMDALTEPYRNDDGDIDVDTLRQEPETGEVDGDGSGDGGEGGDSAGGVETLSLSDREEVQRLAHKRGVFESRDMAGRADTLESEICNLVGVDEFDEINLEAL